jgi:phosphoglycerol transferase MdoB-like AlkP superfamily enzyme
MGAFRASLWLCCALWVMRALVWASSKTSTISSPIHGQVVVQDVLLVFATALLMAALQRIERRLRPHKTPMMMGLVGAAVTALLALQTYAMASVGQPIGRNTMRYLWQGGAAFGGAGVDTRALLLALAVVVASALFAYVARNARRPRAAAFVILMAGVAVAVHPTGRSAWSWSPLASLWVDGVVMEPASNDNRPWDESIDAPSPGVTMRAPPKHVVVWLQESTAFARTSLGEHIKANADTTPYLRQLADEQGVVFDRFVASSPLSIKSITSLMCGAFPYPDVDIETHVQPRIACDSLPELLTRHGFAAQLLHGGYFAFTDKLALLEDRGFSQLIDGENHPQRDAYFTNGWGIDDASLLPAARAFWDAHQNQPTLTVVITLYPHHEYFLPKTAPKPFGTSSMLAHYQNGLRYEDEQLRLWVSELRARGMWDDTLLLWMGDHGEAFDEHPGNQQHGNAIYRENVHTPLVVVSPLLQSAVRVHHQLSTHADIVPSLADWLHLPPAARSPMWQGQSLANADDDRYVPLFTFLPRAQLGMVSSTFFYVDNGNQLFSWDDKAQAHNVAAGNPTITADMRRRSHAFLRQQRWHWQHVPTLGPGYLEQLARVLDRPLEATRVFNMERRCIPFSVPAGQALRLRLDATQVPLPSMLGVGLSDGSRMAKRGPVRVDVREDDAVPKSLMVTNAFESCSKVMAVHARQSIDITLTADASRGSPNNDVTGCLWASP